MNNKRERENFRYYERCMENRRVSYAHARALCIESTYFKRQPLYKQILWRLIK
jgi:hypothetical protein